MSENEATKKLLIETWNGAKTETRAMRDMSKERQGDLESRATKSACRLVVDRIELVVSSMALDSLLSIVSTSALQGEGLVLTAAVPSEG